MDDGRDKRRPIAATQWLAARAVSEGAMPTRRLVAAVLGCDDSAVYGRAALEGWRQLDFRTSAARAAHDEFIERVAAYRIGDDPAISFARGREAGVPPNGMKAEREAVADAADMADFDPAAGGEAIHGDEDDPLALLARSARLLTRRLAGLVSRAEAGGRLNKVEIDGLLALARMTERWEVLAKERANREEAQSDEEIARTLRIIDERIIELAQGEAARLVAAGYRPDAGAEDTG